MPGQSAPSIAQARTRAAALMAEAGVESPALDARLLLEAATGLDAAAQAGAPERLLTVGERARFEALLARRAAREPLSQILGRAGFWTLDLKVTADVLTPRPETEVVLETALEATAGMAEGRVLDLGVGPGTLLLAFLVERPGWFGVGVDVSAAALAVAADNAARLGLRDRATLLQGDWDAPLAGGRGFALVLSNPPYIASDEIAGLAPEVRDREPRLALDGGADGLDAYRRLIPALRGLLEPDGTAVFEVGAGQGEPVARLAKTAFPASRTEIRVDLAGRDRVVSIRP